MMYRKRSSWPAEAIGATLVVWLVAAAPVHAAFIIPQHFDFGDGSGKYVPVVQSGGAGRQPGWEQVNYGNISGSHGYYYSSDSLNVRIANDTSSSRSLGLLADFDDLGGGNQNDFLASLRFTITDIGNEWMRFQLWALADNSLGAGGSGGEGYVMHLYPSGGGYLEPLRKGGYGGENLSSTLSFPVRNNDEFAFELAGTYGEQGGESGLFLDVRAWNLTTDDYFESLGIFDSNPPEGTGFGFGMRRAGRMNVHEFSVTSPPVPFITPQHFDLGSDEGKYNHVAQSAGWEQVNYSRLIHDGDHYDHGYEYGPDGLNISIDGDTSSNLSLGLLSRYDDLGGGKPRDFAASLRFTIDDIQNDWSRFQLWALAEGDLGDGPSGGKGYVVNVARRADDGTEGRLYALRKGGFEGDVLVGNVDPFPVRVGDEFRFDLAGSYGEQGGESGLFLDLRVWNLTTEDYFESLGVFDPNPPEGTGFGFGLRRGGSMTVHEFTVIPEPGAWLLLLSALACGLLARRRR